MLIVFMVALFAKTNKVLFATLAFFMMYGTFFGFYQRSQVAAELGIVDPEFISVLLGAFVTYGFAAAVGRGIRWVYFRIKDRPKTE